MTWELFKGDCLGEDGLPSLADKSVDHVLVDPPYDEHTHSAARSSRMSSDARSGGKEKPGAKPAAASRRCVDLGFAALAPEQMRGAAEQFARVSKRWVLVFCTIEMVSGWRAELERAGLEYIRCGIWRKLGSTPQFTGDRPGTGVEAIVIAHPPGKKRWNGGGRVGVWECPIVLDRGAGGERRVHTTQKPLRLMEMLVEDFTEPGDLILDAFAGSGTTGVAARRLGRRFMGWEMDPAYAALARERIAAVEEQTILPLARAPRPKQLGLTSMELTADGE